MILPEGLPPDRSKEFEYFPEIIDNLLSLLPEYTKELPRKAEIIYSQKEFEKKLSEILKDQLMTSIDINALTRAITNSIVYFLEIYRYNKEVEPATSFTNPLYLGFRESDHKVIRRIVIGDSERFPYFKSLEENNLNDVINLHDYLKKNISLE